MSFHLVTGEQYSKSANFFQEWIKLSLKDHVTPQKKVYNKMLDIGCGTGEGTNYYEDFFKPNNVLGIDKNESYVEYAATHSNKSKKSCFKQCDLNVEKDQNIRDILKDHKDIDLIVSSFTLEYVHDPISVFKTLKESFSGPVEHVYLETCKLFDPFIKMMTSIPQNPKWKNYLQAEAEVPSFMTSDKPTIPSEQFTQSIKNLNYKIIKEAKIPFTFTFTTYEAEIFLLKWALPFTKSIPADKMDEFLHDCYTELRKDAPDPKGKFEWTGENYLLHAIS